MDTRTVVKQVALSLFARRKKWVVLTTLAALVLLVPVAYVLSKEPPRYRTDRDDPDRDQGGTRTPVFQEFSPNRPLSVQLAILQSRLLAASVVEALPKTAVDDLIHNPYGRDYIGDLMDWVGRLRGKEPAAPTPQRRAVGELRRDRVQVRQPERQLRASWRSRPKPPSPRSRSTSPTPTSRCCWPGRGPSTSTTRRAPASTCRSRPPRSPTRSSRSEAAMRAFTLSRGGVQIPAKSTETAQRLSQLETTLAEVSGQPEHQPDPSWRP